MQQQTSFGQILYRRRKELGLTQSQLARMIGVQPNYIVYLEKGERHPSDRTVKKVAVALELDKGELFLAANPQVRDFLNVDEDNVIHHEYLPIGLKALLEDDDLCNLFDITGEEIALLAKIRFDGRVTEAQQYLSLLLNIRYIFS
ncbi:helix-turn-helix domain-containing protein [Myxococcota bacterium]|nr:helix-turn-helix domain-containing protein [Myxococcota bacterium]MBU1431432.1 helix-turn-helix domain-containing protein [Myxococcota bacterium]MBU1898872.1 helix-turn-helix domain-containing protein [Myxococcota bacterium]